MLPKRYDYSQFVKCLVLSRLLYSGQEPIIGDCWLISQLEQYSRQNAVVGSLVMLMHSQPLPKDDWECVQHDAIFCSARRHLSLGWVHQDHRLGRRKELEKPGLRLLGEPSRVTVLRLIQPDEWFSCTTDSKTRCRQSRSLQSRMCSYEIWQW